MSWNKCPTLVLTLTMSALATPALAGPHDDAPPGPKIEQELPEDRRPSRRADGRPVVIKNARILPVEGAPFRGALLISDGKIAAMGPTVAEPEGALVIDAEGQFVMPGVIDCHSHMAIEGGVNEMSEKLSPEVRIGDVVNHEDTGIYRALAGGVTAAQLLHGSANPIGGQAAVIKLRYGKTAPELLFKEAPRGIKFALGENPKRRSGFPRTRQGVTQTMRRAFTEARQYIADWSEYEALKAAGKPALPPRRDLRLETYAGIMKGEIRVHSHCYRADEIVQLLKVADEFGFKVATLQHVLEGYKVAPEIARHGAGGSTFSDWWAYKIEAYDAIPHNAALMTRAGVLASINSDSGELIRHLPLEAAKSMRYGGLDANSCLRLVTLNPAIQLGIDRWTGSLKVGKHADLAIWNGHPLSVFSRPVLTMVDGEIYFDKPARRPAAAPAWQAPASLEGTHAITRSQGDVYLIKGARIHPVSRPAFTGDLLMRNGRIAALGADIAAPAGARVLTGRDLHVAPGFIDSGGSLGLTEIGAVDMTQDLRESGVYQPDIVALDAIHPDSALLPVTRLAGTTMALTVPSGGTISGQASLFRLDGWVAKDMGVRRRAGLSINFPATPKEAKGKNKQLDALTEYLEEARRYDKRRREDPKAPVDARLEALRDAVNGKQPVLMQINDARVMVEAIGWCKKQKLTLILRGAREAWKIADYLAAEKIPVLVGPVMAVPRGAYEPWDSVYGNPAALAAAGVRFAIQSNEASNARILPFEAGMAAAHGLDPARALESITLAPARIFGIDGEVGSLERGKVADVLVSVGHPLEPSSHLTALFIEGKPVALRSKQTELYERYSERLREMKKTGGAGAMPGGRRRR